MIFDSSPSSKLTTFNLQLKCDNIFFLLNTHHQISKSSNYQIKSSHIFVTQKKKSAHQHISKLAHKSSYFFLLKNTNHQTTTFRQAQGKNHHPSTSLWTRITKSSAVTQLLLRNKNQHTSTLKNQQITPTVSQPNTP